MPLQIEVDGSQLQQAESYKYLGTIIDADGKDGSEIKTRIAMARKAFKNIERVLKDISIYLTVRLKILHCYVWSVVPYASEAWAINRKIEKRITVLEMWCYRCVNRIKWVDRVINAAVLSKIGVAEPILLKWIKDNKKRYIEEKRRNDRIFAVASTGIIVGKAPRGRRRRSILDECI